MGLMILSTFISYKPILTALLYGIPNTVILSFGIYHTFNIMLWKMIYFYLMCYYIKIKSNLINDRIINLMQKINSIKIKNIMKALNRLYVEINEYNTTYWSKFLLSVWIIFGSVIVVLIYIILFKYFIIF